MPLHSPLLPTVAVIGGGPAGLMAAEVLAAAGASVDLYDTMPSVGRKFLLAGKGGLNLTHGEDSGSFVGRYGGSFSIALASSVDMPWMSRSITGAR